MIVIIPYTPNACYLLGQMEGYTDKNCSSQTSINDKTLQCIKNRVSFSIHGFLLIEKKGQKRKWREQLERKKEVINLYL